MFLCFGFDDTNHEFYVLCLLQFLINQQQPGVAQESPMESSSSLTSMSSRRGFGPRSYSICVSSTPTSLATPSSELNGGTLRRYLRRGSFLTTISTILSSPFTQRDTHQAKHEPVQLNSGVYPDGPSVPLQSRKLLMFVDVTPRIF
jgi:hypothetical protein